MEKFGVVIIAWITLCSVLVFATDPNQLQDFCVATSDPNGALFVNGQFCKDPALVTQEDFLFQGLNKPGVLNKFGSIVTLVSATNLPGLNTLGISMARIDFGPNGQNPPHIHPRASEILTVVKGRLLVGFVTSNKANAPNQLFTKMLKEGDVFVFPQGLIHFQQNVDKNNPAVAIVALSSQNPGAVTIANALFGSNPPIDPNVLSIAFRANLNTINLIQTQFQT